MLQKKVIITVPENIKASDLLPFAEKVLKEHTDQGWKIGGIIHTPSLEKPVILYK